MSSTENLAISERVYGYLPNNALAIAAATVYGMAAAVLLLRVVTSKAWWALCLPIGSFFEALGFALRSVSKYNPDSVALFATEGFFIICTPAAFLAFNYITYGRLILHVGAEHSIMNPQRVAKIFVVSDVFTFLIQAGGSGLQTSEKMANIGQKTVLVGLTLQAISYGFFCFLLVKSHLSIRSNGAFIALKPCMMIIRALYFSSAFIIVRCIYRVVEYAQGRHGYLLTHEVFLYTLDTLPLILAIIVYIPWWPANYIKYEKREGREMSTVLGA